MADRPTVLIVDDDPDARRLLRMLFEFEDYEVVGEATDGVEAVMLARQHEPQFALVDEFMPRMLGSEAASLIRTLSPDTRIIAFSASLASKPKWADAFLNKDRIGDVVPFLAELLIEDDRSGVTRSAS